MNNAKSEAPALYGVIAEFKNQAPILMECEGDNSSHDAAYVYMQKLLSRDSVLRACVVRLVHDGGNALLMHDMQRLQREVE